ncbi:putative tat pathway signal sequence [Podospora aff. communis PSN243]|uniref:Tat pathway signal sequence n=1 Tax=Podospora aff. communis PSN243 TaxID=3040156 RepID=A0AAV9GXA0_9PEZI|nr:putative tat pathway signal sequence [Podospora aff. communis PSN243]
MLVSTALFWAASVALAVAHKPPPPSSPSGGYILKDYFNTSNFFREFDFYSEADPTHGFVTYVDAKTANRDGLAGYSSGGIYLGVDYKTKSTTVGRPSTRVESKKAWHRGLFIADIKHMPAGTAESKGCGLWPAFWTFSKGNWPDNGEIDIIEGVHNQNHNFMVLHTKDTCKVTNNGALTNSRLLSDDCIGYLGCKQAAGSPTTFGADFNKNGGGVYAMEWTNETISVWFFPRNSAMLKNGTLSTASPDPSKFGKPLGRFAPAGCDIPGAFKDQSIIINTSLCGDWAGAPDVWNSNTDCKAMAPTCEAFVGSNPEAFTNAFWIIKEIKVFQKEEGGSGSGNGTEYGGGRGGGKGFGKRGASWRT